MWQKIILSFGFSEKSWNQSQISFLIGTIRAVQYVNFLWIYEDDHSYEAKILWKRLENSSSSNSIAVKSMKRAAKVELNTPEE